MAPHVGLAFHVKHFGTIDAREKHPLERREKLSFWRDLLTGSHRGGGVGLTRSSYGDLEISSRFRALLNRCFVAYATLGI